MKKYGEKFIDENHNWLARWYEGNELKDSKEGSAKSALDADKQASAWLKTKGDK